MLQSYVWQGYDLCPAFPALNKFLNFWLETLEGPLHSVTVAHARLIKPAEIRAIDAVLADGAGRARNLARQTMVEGRSRFRCGPHRRAASAATEPPPFSRP